MKALRLKFRLWLLVVVSFSTTAAAAPRASSAIPDRSFPASERVAAEVDIDGDGDLDFITDRLAGIFDLWINEGSNQWRRNGAVTTSIARPELLVADIDHDGYSDLIIYDRSSAAAPEFWKGAGEGKFKKAAFSAGLSFAAYPQAWSDSGGCGGLPAIHQERTRDDSRHAALWQNSVPSPDERGISAARPRDSLPTRPARSGCTLRGPPSSIS